MGIYIEGMEIPTHCMDCPFMVSREGDDCILQSDEANENFGNWEQMKAGCPLVSIPPHGRLIDADELYQLIETYYDDISKGSHFRSKVSEKNAMRLAYGNCLNDIDNAPTIIPASQEVE